MLLTRILTALVLLTILLPALFAGSAAPLLLLAIVFMAVAAWEWARLNGFSGTVALATGALCAVCCIALWWGGAIESTLPWLWIGAALAWVLGGGWLLARGVAAWPRLPRTLRWAIGLLLLVTAWLALARARTLGVNFLLSVLVLVWTADVFAYFVGRALGGRLTGGRRLAPAISPGKSWEGVAGGMAGTLLLALVWVWIDRSGATESASLYTRLLGAGPTWLVIGTVFLAAMSVVGDLFESLVKRSAGVKDSSQLLPGHGGVLDRIDALLPTLPLALMLLAWLEGNAR